MKHKSRLTVVLLFLWIFTALTALADQNETDKNSQDAKKNETSLQNDYLDPTLYPTTDPSYNGLLYPNNIYFYKSVSFSNEKRNLIYKNYFYWKINVGAYYYVNAGISVKRNGTIFDNILYESNPSLYHSPFNYKYDFQAISDAADFSIKIIPVFNYKPKQKNTAKEGDTSANRSKNYSVLQSFDPSISMGSKNIKFSLNIKKFDKTNIIVGDSYDFWKDKSDYFALLIYNASKKSDFFTFLRYSDNASTVDFGYYHEFQNKTEIKFANTLTYNRNNERQSKVFTIQFRKNF